MKIEPEVNLVEFSKSATSGIPLYTFHVRYWRPIHSEVMTHRQFTRNARSSRAVPNSVLLREPIVEPLVYGSNKPGMSAGDSLTGWRLLLARATWLSLAHITRLGVRLLNFAGLHKQWSNRPLEWFGCIDVLISTTDLANWDTLRISEFAQPEIRQLAVQMRDVVRSSKPRILQQGEWHLPYVNEIERKGLPIDTQIMLSVARCARLSYKPFDGKDSQESERTRYNKLVVSKPVHASPAEHQATPDSMSDKVHWDNPRLHGNFRGWIQYRKQLPGEFVPG